MILPLMDFQKIVGWAKGHRNSLVVVAFVFVLAGADLIVNRPKGDVEWLSIPLLAAGLALLVLIFWPTAKPGPRPRGDTIAQRILWKLTVAGRLVPLFPVFGILLIVADLAYNVYASRTPAILTHDQAVLFLGAVLLAYRFVPRRYDRERDFVLLFAGTLSLILVVPLVLLRALSGNLGASVDAYSTYALAPQTSAILNLIGVQNTLVPAGSYDGPGIAFVTAAGVPVQVFITSACSGIYSFAIFTAAFTAFVLTEQRKLTRRVLAFFALGVIFAYVANVLRMVAIVWIGYSFDTPESDMQNLLFAHSNAGWLIFLGWISLFWALLFRFLPREEPAEKGPAAGVAPPRRRGTFCGICGAILTPAIPATQCQCGKFYHVDCLTTEGRCPSCSTPSPAAVPLKHAA